MTVSSAKPGPKRAEGEMARLAVRMVVLSVETTEMLGRLAREAGVSRSPVASRAGVDQKRIPERESKVKELLIDSKSKRVTIVVITILGCWP
jgi:hypothetical protein